MRAVVVGTLAGYRSRKKMRYDGEAEAVIEPCSGFHSSSVLAPGYPPVRLDSGEPVAPVVGAGVERTAGGQR